MKCDVKDGGEVSNDLKKNTILGFIGRYVRASLDIMIFLGVHHLLSVNDAHPSELLLVGMVTISLFSITILKLNVSYWIFAFASLTALLTFRFWSGLILVLLENIVICIDNWSRVS